MTKDANPGRKGATPPAKNPFPIVVPKGDKHPQGGKVKRWIREILPASSPPSSPDSAANSGPGRRSEPPGGTPDRAATAPLPPSPPIGAESPSAHPIQRATIQMLPGRLQPLDNTVLQQEIRFVRTSEPEQTVTLGWNMGEPPGHVTLNHSSIEPLHAKMTYRDGRWWLENLARHDPVAINGRILRDPSPPRLLENGDQIRMGSVVFRFFFP